MTLVDETDHSDLCERLLADTDVPVLFGVQVAPKPNSTDYVRWERRLQQKLEQHLGSLEALASADALADLELDKPTELHGDAPTLSPWITPGDLLNPAQQIWVLGASLGGPAAIKEFLDSLPPGLPVGFVYAQHIDGNFTDVLTRVLGRHAHYKLKHAVHGEKILNGEVVLLPVQHEWAMASDGTLMEKDTPWPGPYSPSIDQVLLNMGDHYGPRCHAILFSGMGNDGAIAAPFLRAYGSQVWVQNSDTCGNSSMPDSVAATGCVSFIGTPARLAQELVKTLEKSCLLQRRQQRDSA